MAKFNPFQPNQPVHVGMFAGRTREVDHLEDNLLQARAGNPRGFMVTGERGMGKTSLLHFARAVAEGRIPFGYDGDERLKFLVIQTDIDQATTQLGLVKKIELGLRKAIQANEAALGFFLKTWDFLKHIEVKGAKLKEPDAENPTEVIIEECAYSLASTVNALTSSRTATEFGLGNVYDGVLLLIDEADNADPHLQLGSFLKLLSERTCRNGCQRFVVGLAGLPKLRDVLEASHPSSLRLFEELELEPLSRKDVARVISEGLREANEKNSNRMAIMPDAQETLINLAEGFPHFIQQFCYCAFAKDIDWIISGEDVVDSAFEDGGAIELIGNCYYRDAFYNKIKQESYRKVLRIMASKVMTPTQSVWITKDEIRRSFHGKPTTLDNAIHALLSKNIIVPKEGTLGTYRLVHKGFAWWIRLFTSDPEQVKKISQEDGAKPSGAAALATPPEHSNS